MHGDYSRYRFDPFQDFAAVLNQQGRVALDADWNELNEILQRRWRAETVDIIGRCVVPQETPDGFNIRIAGVGPQRTMTIGPGRMYVDGLLAENHGGAPFAFDMATARPDGSPVGVLGELVGQEPVRYEEQPYRGALLDYPAGNGPHLVYLDVWLREVTALQAASLLEEALGGVDTTTRLQTVWQVRFLENIPGTVTCATPDAEIPGWLDLTRPTAGRLSTRTREEAQPSDPCLLPPSGGYRGWENQLYRIEVHDGGTRTEATFKWSRNNASVGTRIESFEGVNIIRVASLGRDEMLGFAVGDWAEVTDDRRELDGLSGDMVQIVATNPDSREVTLSDNLSADLIPTNDNGDTAGNRHSRMVQWNQNGRVFDADGNELIDLDSDNSGGVIPIPTAGTWVHLEHGVEVSFDFVPADGRLRSGDNWMVAARIAPASIEMLERAPPRGIHHHYCHLAIVRWAPPVIPIPGPMQLDCRILWPPDFGGDNCACTVCVTAESHNNGRLTIQQAITRVTGTGGTVCLGPGNFFLGETPVNIEGQSIRLKGQGPRTMLVYPGREDDPPPAISVEDSRVVVIENLTVVTPGSTDAAAIRVRTSSTVVIERCLLFQLLPRERESVLPMISIGGAVVDLSIRDNWIFAKIGIAGVPGPGDFVGMVPQVATAGLYIRENVMFCDLVGAALEMFVVLLGETDISDNFFNGTSVASIRVMGTVAEGAPLDVKGNTIRKIGGDGIAVAAGNARIADNDITAVNPGRDGNGIVLTEVSVNEGEVDHCQVLGNRITHLGGAGIVVDTHLRSAVIKNNIIDSVSRGGITMGAESSADDLTIENNQVRNVAFLNPGTGETLTAFRIVNAQNVAVVGNTIDGVAVEAIGNPNRAGIQVVASRSIRVAGNELVHIGPAETGGPGIVHIGGIATGIDVVAPFDRVDLTDNTVRRSRARPNNPDPSSWFAVRIRQVGNQFQFTDGLTSLLLPADDTGAVLRVTARLFILPRGQEITAIRGNLLESHDSTVSLVSVGGQGTCVFTDNRCVASFGPLADFSPADVCVALAVGRAIVSNNYVEVPVGTTPIRLNPASDALNFFTVLGNITSGSIRIGDAPLPAPWADLNVGAL